MKNETDWETGDIVSCKSCLGDSMYNGDEWLHVAISPRFPSNGHVVNLGDPPAPMPSYSEWYDKVDKAGWALHTIADGWIHDESEDHYSVNDMMEFFRAGETPPPIEWEDVATGSDLTKLALSQLNAIVLWLSTANIDVVKEYCALLKNTLVLLDNIPLDSESSEVAP